MSREVVSWNEARVAFWTGTATASAFLNYGQNLTLNLVRGVQSEPRLDGTYCNTVTGKRGDLYISQYFAADLTLARMADSATAVHMRLLTTAYWGSAGINLWSGFLDGVNLYGAENGQYQFVINYHANDWEWYG